MTAALTPDAALALLDGIWAAYQRGYSLAVALEAATTGLKPSVVLDRQLWRQYKPEIGRHVRFQDYAMGFDEIAAALGISRQGAFNLYQCAMRKLYRRRPLPVLHAAIGAVRELEQALGPSYEERLAAQQWAYS